MEIVEDEGKILHAYLCSEGHKTVGVGHKVLPEDPEDALPVHGAYDDVTEDDQITEERCFDLFRQDVVSAIDGCIAIYDNWKTIPQEAQHILINMCFQLGRSGLGEFRNMNAAVESGDWATVAIEMMDSRWAKQTPNRAERLRDRALALVGD